MLRLPPHRRFPGYPQPGEILIDRRLEFRPASCGVDILDPQQESSPRAVREVAVQHRRIGVTEMEVAVRSWTKSENGCHGPPDNRHCRARPGNPSYKNLL